MKVRDLIIGTIIGFATTFIGMMLYLYFFTDYNLIKNFYSLKVLGLVGKIMTLGAILNIIVFYFLLKKDKEMMARGIILATIILTIITIFV